MNGVRKIFLLIVLTGVFITTARSQNFIGMSPESIASVVRNEFPQFKLDKNTVNHNYKYLKYVDRISDQTILFFLSDNDRCVFVRWMSDYSNLNEMVEMLNKKYNKGGKNLWTYADNSGKYTVKMEEEEWYFTVSFRKN